MNKKIIVPLDGSRIAEGALPCAEEMGGRLAAEIILVGVCHSKLDQMQNMRQSYLNHTAENVARRISETYGIPRNKISVNDVMLFGKPANEIVAYTQKVDADLVIMTTHGYSGVERIALGSVADAVVRKVHKPVLLIRAKHGKPEVSQKEICTKVVIPLDGSKLAEAALPVVETFMGDLASHHKVKAHLLHVLKPLPDQERLAKFEGKNLYNITDEGIHRLAQSVREHENMAHDYLSHVGNKLCMKKGVDTDFDVRTGEPAEEIIKYAEEKGANTIVMSTHGLTGIDRWAMGSVTERILRRGHAAIMLVCPF
ncbi:MAG: universal stress protein [Deltaproteobacteria bacterium]|nr:universal stress protein [Deltaproteobacteria bacterium]